MLLLEELRDVAHLQSDGDYVRLRDGPPQLHKAGAQLVHVELPGHVGVQGVEELEVVCRLDLGLVEQALEAGVGHPFLEGVPGDARLGGPQPLPHQRLLLPFVLDVLALCEQAHDLRDPRRFGFERHLPTVLHVATEQALELALDRRGVLPHLLVLPHHLRRDDVLDEDGHDQVEHPNRDEHGDEDVEDHEDRAVRGVHAIGQGRPVKCRAAVCPAAEEREHRRAHLRELGLVLSHEVGHGHANQVDQADQQDDGPGQDTQAGDDAQNHQLELVEDLEPQRPHDSRQTCKPEDLDQQECPQVRFIFT
mmetsp:Transcript_93011/g.277671  ORF Transcript_93011/g.277671 Transcript_93011/m.277671 type:complete len:307 (+) Transcript_93011:167-1087(+)